jgi:hypothetical protein
MTDAREISETAIKFVLDTMRLPHNSENIRNACGLLRALSRRSSQDVQQGGEICSCTGFHGVEPRNNALVCRRCKKIADTIANATPAASQDVQAPGEDELDGLIATVLEFAEYNATPMSDTGKAAEALRARLKGRRALLQRPRDTPRGAERKTQTVLGVDDARVYAMRAASPPLAQPGEQDVVELRAACAMWEQQCAQWMILSETNEKAYGTARGWLKAAEGVLVQCYTYFSHLQTHSEATQLLHDRIHEELTAIDSAMSQGQGEQK